MLDITGGGPIEGPPVFGPEAYICELRNDAPPAKRNTHSKICKCEICQTMAVPIRKRKAGLF